MTVPTIPDLVSTIIPVYNRPEMVRVAVDSVLAQTYRPIEIILINDGSTDESSQVLDALAAAHPDVIHVIHKENGGPGLAREAGRQIVQGEFIQYLDSDDWLLPNKFADQVSALRAHPECGIAYGISRVVDDQGAVLWEPSKWTGHRIDYLFPGLLVDRWWHTHTPLFRREVSDAAGAWPKQRPEDWDLEARMGAHRTRLVFVDQVLSCQRNHPSAQRVSRGDQDAYLRDEAWFLPRLFACALAAGVPMDAPEMKHFARWVFMTARYLGASGESACASDLMRLARRASASNSLDMTIVNLMARLFGWRFTGRLFTRIDHYRTRILSHG